MGERLSPINPEAHQPKEQTLKWSEGALWLDPPDGPKRLVAEMGAGRRVEDMVHMVRMGAEVIITPQYHSGTYRKKEEFILPASTKLRYDNYSDKFVTLTEILPEESEVYDYRKIVKAITKLDLEKNSSK